MRWREKEDGVMNGGSEGEIGTERAEREGDDKYRI